MDMIVGLLITLIIVGVVWWLCTYIFDNIPLPGPIAQIGKVIVTVLCVLYVVAKVLLPLVHANLF
jgi:hypothetical protein